MANRYSFSSGTARGRVTRGGRGGWDGMQQQPYRIGAKEDQFGNVERQSATPPGQMTPDHNWSGFNDAFATHMSQPGHMATSGQGGGGAVGNNPLADPDFNAALASGNPVKLAEAYKAKYGYVPQQFKGAVAARLESDRMERHTTKGADGKLYTDNKAAEAEAKADNARIDALFSGQDKAGGNVPDVTENYPTGDSAPRFRVGPTGITSIASSRSGPREVAVSPNARQAATLLTGVDPATVSPEQRTQNLRDAVGQPRPVRTIGDPSTETAQVTPIDPRYQAPGGPAIGTTRYVEPPVDIAPITVNGPQATADAYRRSGLADATAALPGSPTGNTNPPLRETANVPTAVDAYRTRAAQGTPPLLARPADQVPPLLARPPGPAQPPNPVQAPPVTAEAAPATLPGVSSNHVAPPAPAVDTRPPQATPSAVPAPVRPTTQQGVPTVQVPQHGEAPSVTASGTPNAPGANGSTNANWDYQNAGPRAANAAPAGADAFARGGPDYSAVGSRGGPDYAKERPQWYGENGSMIEKKPDEEEQYA